MSRDFIGIRPGSFQHRERFPAHSYVLAISSSVFNAMFNSGFEKQAEIVVPDVEPTAFRILLKSVDNVLFSVSNTTYINS